MNKKQLHHFWRTFRLFKPQYFLLAAGVCSLIAVGALRSNNQQMADYRKAVYVADEQNGDVQAALHNLQSWVTAHMNTDLSTGNTAVYPPIQLQHTYERLVQQQSQAVQAANSGLYTEAQNYCQAQNSTDYSGRNRVPCIEQYVQDHGLKAAAAIPASLYQFDFVTPWWSPDLAGWMVFTTIVLLLISAAKLTADIVIRRQIR